MLRRFSVDCFQLDFSRTHRYKSTRTYKHERELNQSVGTSCDSTNNSHISWISAPLCLTALISSPAALSPRPSSHLLCVCVCVSVLAWPASSFPISPSLPSFCCLRSLFLLAIHSLQIGLKINVSVCSRARERENRAKMGCWSHCCLRYLVVGLVTLLTTWFWWHYRDTSPSLFQCFYFTFYHQYASTWGDFGEAKIQYVEKSSAPI